MLKRFKEHFGKQDVIFFTGDFSAHHVAMPHMDSEDTYALLLDTFSEVNQLLVQYFPDTLILPAFGNNDSKYHDNPIPEADRAFFYEYIYRLWFQMLPGNKNKLTQAQ